MRKRYLKGSVPRNVGSVLLRDVVFGVIIRNYNFGGRGGLFPWGSIGSFRLGVGYFSLSVVGVGSELKGMIRRGGVSSPLVFVSQTVGTKILGILEFWNLGM